MQQWLTTHGSKLGALVLSVLAGFNGLDPTLATATFGDGGKRWIAFLVAVATLAHSVFIAHNGNGKASPPPPSSANTQKGAARAGHLVGLAVFALVGCAALGLSPAQSFDEQLSYAYGTHTAVLQATASAKASGALSESDVTHVASVADQARALLDSARAVETTNPHGAADRLKLATSILTELQSWLHGKGVT